MYLYQFFHKLNVYMCMLKKKTQKFTTWYDRKEDLDTCILQFKFLKEEVGKKEYRSNWEKGGH